jgi:hypothetical protein
MRRTTFRCAATVMAMTVAWLSFLERRAAASPAYPAVVEETWALARAPECTICHATSSGGTGTVVTYFGRHLQELGVTAESPSTLAQALELDRAQGTDSDGSGTTDYEDLAAGRSPNAGPGPVADGGLRPEHGCATTTDSPRSGDTLFVVALSSAAVGLRRRRGRAR